MGFSAEELTQLLSAAGSDPGGIFSRANSARIENTGEKVFLRGLIEYSNICKKDCLYCGIRCGNGRSARYTLTEEDVFAAARRAWKEGFGSVVIQAGEQNSKTHIAAIGDIIKGIKKLSRGELGITLSLGEQSADTYRRWFEAGAHRYLLRIESSSRELYEKIHPADGKHTFERRLKALEDLREVGYQVGTGVMIGLPFQNEAMLADDLLFIRDFNADMCGMGPYIVHRDTPLYRYSDIIPTAERRVELTLRMIALLRLMMPDINIAATTALQSLDPKGRERALHSGANVVMPNITPQREREEYKLYENKPVSEEMDLSPEEIARNEWGDSKRFFRRTANK